jgi:hypothetical protein
MNGDLIYWSMVAAFVTHELDAVKRHEWRVLPLTRWMPEHIGEHVFIWAHAPLLFLVFWLSGASADGAFAIALSVFSVVHVGLHWFYRKHPAYEFNNAGSWSLILLTGALGAAHLAVLAA